MSKNVKTSWDVLVIGAGASGMMAAISAARAGKKVLILEQSEKPGKKILATGNGKCNFTNAYISSDCFHGDSAYYKKLMESFTTKNCLDFFHSIGIFPKEKNGYYYPNSEQASSVVVALTEELRRLSVEIQLQTKVDKIFNEKDVWRNVNSIR
jgi:predicted Rossmann fold flavoprotein